MKPFVFVGGECSVVQKYTNNNNNKIVGPLLYSSTATAVLFLRKFQSDNAKLIYFFFISRKRTIHLHNILFRLYVRINILRFVFPQKRIYGGEVHDIGDFFLQSFSCTQKGNDVSFL